MKNKETTSRFLSIFRQIRMPAGLLALAAAFALLRYWLALHAAEMSAEVIDASGHMEGSELMSYVTAMALIAIAASMKTLFSGRAAEKINLELRLKIWDHLLRKEEDSDREEGEALVSRISTDCDYAGKYFTVILNSLTAAIGAAVILVKLFQTDSRIALAVLIIIPLSILAGRIYGKMLYSIGVRFQEAVAETTGYLIERSSFLDQIRVSNMQEEELEEGLEHFEEIHEMEMELGYTKAGITVIVKLLGFVTAAVVFALGGKLVHDGTLSTGVVVMLYTLSQSIASECAELIENFGSIERAEGSLERVAEILAEPEEDSRAGIILESGDAVITLKDLSFSYGEKQVLEHVNCTIPMNQVTVIVGGSGKSTLLKLIAGRLKAEKGEILYGEHEINSISRKSLRERTAFIEKDARLLEGTLRENLLYGMEESVSDEKLNVVLEQTNLSEKVGRLKNGLDSRVAPAGRNFSPGECQRISLARAVVRNPEYLFMDEAESSLDDANRKTMMKAAHNIMKERTTVMITKEKPELLNADHMIVLKDKTVYLEGKPFDIMEKDKEIRNYLMG